MPLLFSEIQMKGSLVVKRPFSLSPRLQAVADMVPQGAKLADVGTDHGRLPVWLIQHGIVEQAICSDLRPGPLSRAKALAECWQVSDKAVFRLCDGLSGISSPEADVITIAGMGGETIAEILRAARWSNEPGHTYILQAMSGMDGLRRYLSDNEFAICKEVLVEEGETLYVILLAQPGKMRALTEGEIWVGRQDRQMDCPLRNRYLEQELQKLHRAVAGLERSRRPEDVEKKKWYELAAWEVAQMKKEWEEWRQ